MTKIILSLATFAFIGCGGGIDGGSKLSDLSQGDTDDLCDELVDDYPEKTVDCGMGVTVTVGFKAADCTDNTPPSSTCTATVDDVRDCTATLYEGTRVCMDVALPASCMRLQACEM